MTWLIKETWLLTAVCYSKPMKNTKNYTWTINQVFLLAISLMAIVGAAVYKIYALNSKMAMGLEVATIWSRVVLFIDLGY